MLLVCYGGTYWSNLSGGSIIYVSAPLVDFGREIYPDGEQLSRRVPKFRVMQEASELVYFPIYKTLNHLQPDADLAESGAEYDYDWMLDND